MPRQTRNNLIRRIANVRDAFLPGVNSALIIGALLLDMFDSNPADWIENEVYNPGDRVVWRGMIYSCLEVTKAGESPETTPTKWDSLLAQRMEQIGENLPDLPVTQKLLVAYVNKMLPKGSGGASNVPIKATDEQFNAGTNDTSFITPKQAAALKAAIIRGVTAPEFDLESMREGFSIVVKKQVDDSLVMAFESPDQQLFRMLKNASATTKALFCTIVAACSINPDDDIYEVTDLLRLVGSTTTPGTTTPIAHNYKAQADIISCDLVTGWLLDTLNLNMPGELDIFINNELAGSVSATKTRKDVADQYGGSANSLYGFEFLVPAKYRKGIPLQIRVYVRDTQIEANYGMSNTTAACGTPATNPTPTPVYVIQNRLDGPGVLYEGGNELVWWVTERLSDGTERLRTGASTFSIVEGKPAGLTLTPFENGSKLKMQLSDIDFTKRVTLRADVGGGYCEGFVQLVDTTCYRPAGLAYKPMLVFATAPAAGGNAHAFETLDDAIESMRSHFDGSVPKLFNPFKAEMADYNDGTDVFLNWSPDDRSCAKANDQIFYVLDGDGKNGQLIAIQVANGKIVRSKRVPANNNKVIEMAVTCCTLDYTYDPLPEHNVFDMFILWRTQGNVDVWVGTYLAPDDSTNFPPSPTYTTVNGVPVSDARSNNGNNPPPASWSRFTRLAGVNTLTNYYRCRIVARLGSAQGPILVDYTFDAYQRPFLPKTVYTAPS